MTKYNQTFKQQVVDFYFTNHESLSITCKHFDLPNETARRWIVQFKHSGSSGLAVRHSKQKYSPEFKFNVVQSVLLGQFSGRGAALHFGLSSSGMISQWLKTFEKQGIKGLLPKPKGRQTMKPKYPKMPPKPKNRLEELELENLRLRAENDFLKKLDEINQTRRQETAEAVQALRLRYPLALLLEIAGLSRSVFFYHIKPKTDKDEALRAEIRKIKAKHPEYGYRRVAAELKGVNHKKIQRFMREMGLQVKSKKCRKYNAYHGEVGRIAENRLKRDFTASKPNEKWLTDITEFKAEDGNKLYFSPILDTFNNELIAHHTSTSPNWALVETMLQNALKKRAKGEKTVLHSDQGWHYQMRAYQHILRENGIEQSMSRKGNCLDNAAMESFFGRMKTERFYGKSFKTVDEIKIMIDEYVRYYNEERIQLKLKGLSPIQYRRQSLM
ncbi:IS3 family transposase [Lonepinella sp. MS14435]|uniref:IS3 family transposase n=1 Tax=Lonepinella sp. MS14435 TaxID=3003618 RepID=UPI0036D95732